MSMYTDIRWRRGRWRCSIATPSLTLLLTSLLWALGGVVHGARTPFEFTSSLYNVTIPENSPVRTYVTSEQKLGIHLMDPDIRIKYDIVGSDPSDKLFKAVDEVVGDFAFLRIRTKPCKNRDNCATGSIGLNRELQDEYRFTVQAEGKIKKQMPYKASVDVIVKIKDLNDMRPIFDQQVYEVTVDENLPVDSAIATVEATDADMGINGEVYYSFKFTTDVFSIHPTSGVVTLTRPLDYQRQNQYRILVIAKDRGMMSYDTSMPFESQLRISVKQVNIHAPVVRVEKQPFLPRTSEPEQIFAVLTVSDEDPGSNGDIHLPRIVEGDSAGNFKVVKGTKRGTYQIQVTKPFRRSLPSVFNITVAVSDQGDPSKTTTELVEVRLSGPTSHASFFRQQTFNITLSEDVQINTAILSIAPELETTGFTVFYAIPDIAAPFSVGDRNGIVFVAKELDRETKPFYNVTIQARNTRQIVLTVAHILVTVLDTNDNSPVFEQSGYFAEMKENMPIGSPVLQVRALDLDEGENGFISYSIANLNPVPFTIDHMTGNINISKVVDYETMRHEYHLRVRASDWGVPFRREAEVDITVHVVGVNDNRPRFEKVDCTGTITRTLSPGENIAIISAIDFDKDFRQLSIVAGNTNDLFFLDPNSGNLTLKRSIGDNDPQLYNLKIMASDAPDSASFMYTNISIVNNRNTGPRGHSKESKVRCRETSALAEMTQLISQKSESQKTVDNLPGGSTDLYNSNRHIPQFDSSFPSAVTIDEDTPVGTSVAQISAADLDHGFNGKIAYALSDGNIGFKFAINPDTGLITVARSLDREEREFYELAVKISDNGQPRKTEKRNLQVLLWDVNDNAPRFDMDSYQASISEDAEEGFIFLSVHASDRDMGRNREIRYSIVSDSPLFAINSENGELSTAGGLDRETSPVHTIRIQATDLSPDNPLSSVVTVSVELMDVNDNAPYCILPTYRLKMREDLPIGAAMMTIQALDPDNGANGTVRYSFVKGQDDKFDIDEEWGTIRLKQMLDYEDVQYYSILLALEDGGNPSNTSECHVIVNVVDVDENMHTPTFDTFVAIGSVAENATVGTEVMQISAADPDPGMDGKVTYSIRDGSGLGRFTIDKTGSIFTKERLDRETIPHFWLTIYAQDHGAIPRHSVLQVYIEVEDVNDNAPQPSVPVFRTSVMENTEGGVEILAVDATDADEDQRLSFSLGAEALRYFAINSKSGVITTTYNSLDREEQEEHTLQLTIRDNGVPSRSSTAQVIITVNDENDNAPMFTENFYRIDIPARDVEDDEDPESLFRVFATDKDTGSNAEISYYIRGEGNTASRFTIAPTTGVISTNRLLVAGELFDISLEAEDNGRPLQKRTQSRLLITVMPAVALSPNPPVFLDVWDTVVEENMAVGEFVTSVFAIDEDNDRLWYTITGGNIVDAFAVSPSDGIILLAGRLDAETTRNYDLTISVSDGFNEVSTTIRIDVLDYNDNIPELEQEIYTVDLLENEVVGTEVVRVVATDPDIEDKLSYRLYSTADSASMDKFDVDLWTGMITIKEPLDHEIQRQHILNVEVKDQGLVTHRTYARVVINIVDINDHIPLFGAESYSGQVFETAAVGTQVLEVYAYDRDEGVNAEVIYSILSVRKQGRPRGNYDDAFNIDPVLGSVTVSSGLNLKEHAKYLLLIQAEDHGESPLRSTCYVNISVTLSNNAPPRFTEKQYIAEITENRPADEFVTEVSASSRSSVYYDIVSGNEARHFDINANTGIVTTRLSLDYESVMFYNLTVQATNMVGISTNAFVIIHVHDMNDNAPRFSSNVFEGSITEAAPLSTVVRDATNAALVISALDVDSDHNAQLVYEIVERDAQKYFTIDGNTGAIRTKMSLDHEKIPAFEFHVQVKDSGVPQLRAQQPAFVKIQIVDINDSPPEFTASLFETTLLLPTYAGVTVLKVDAVDPDTVSISQLQYSITSGNTDKYFKMAEDSGVISVANSNNMQSEYRLAVRVTDGLYHGNADVLIHVEPRPMSGLRFATNETFATIQENDTEIRDIAFLNILGNNINEPLYYSILNPNDLFEIQPTSGILRNTGTPFDREEQAVHHIVVEAQDVQKPPRIAHVVVVVEVLDVNDNVPVFVHHQYDAVVQVDARVGEVVRQVTAIDHDSGANGDVKYTLVGGGDDFFAIDSSSGVISVNQVLGNNAQNKNFTLQIKASDRGKPKHSTVIDVPIIVRNKAMPVFQEHYYSTTISEDITLHSAVIQVQAISPHGRDVIYSVYSGDQFNQFDINPTTGVINVIGGLDYETNRMYSLTVHATDTLTGAYASVTVDIEVRDINDIAPRFLRSVYQIVLSEAVSVGVQVAHISATDLDSPINAKVKYHIIPNGNETSFFHIDSNSGIIFTSQVLDYERFPKHNFVVVAADSGMPQLTTEARVIVEVTDMNDNPPEFSRPVYECTVSEIADRGSFVMAVSATDQDVSDIDKLSFSIVSGNEDMAFSIDSKSGVISLSNTRQTNLGASTAHHLNISVSDRVFTSSAHVHVYISRINHHSPVFSQAEYNVNFPENETAGGVVFRVSATDPDEGRNGEVTYSLFGHEAKQWFQIDSITGEIRSRMPLDLEAMKARTMTIPVIATDTGGRTAYTKVNVILGDKNDNAPIFEFAMYQTYVRSNADVGKQILKMNAVDADSGNNAIITYSFDNSTSDLIVNRFAVNPRSGMVTTTGDLRDIEGGILQFFMEATDNGSPSLTGHVAVEIHILLPVSDPPEFEMQSEDSTNIPMYVIPEDFAVGNVLDTFAAYHNHSVVYSIVPGNDVRTNNPTRFSISQGGALSVISPLDHEQCKWYRLLLKAETVSSPVVASFLEVRITVTDVNDNPPLFEDDVYEIRVPEDVPMETDLLQVHATDLDDGPSGKILYSLGLTDDDLDGEALDVFSIDPETGWISTKLHIDREMVAAYSLLVLASDGGSVNNQHTASATVSINVLDVNDSPPRFIHPSYTGSIAENVPVGTVLLSITASDADLPANANLTYYITGGDPRGHFAVESLSGKLYVARSLDRELVDDYQLNVTVTDGVYMDSTKTTVEIVDVNDNVPVCVQMVYSEDISEAMSPGQYVMQVSATDADAEPNSIITYSLQGPGSEMFDVDEETGVVTVADILDSETQPLYEIESVASDADGNRCSSWLLIGLLDENDNPPMFSESMYNKSVSENTTVNSLLTRVQAVDPDSGNNRKFTFSLVDVDADDFTIDRESGIITLRRTLDREERSQYNLSIRATDSNNAQLYSQAHVIINVMDENDNEPQFEHDVYNVTLSENVPVESHVLTVIASSKDVGVNAQIMYEIIDGNEHGKFTIDTDAGYITVAAELDYEMSNNYFLTVKAMDGGVRPLSDITMVNILIGDANDNKPMFSQDIYYSEINEAARVEDSIAQVMAEDLDSGAFGAVTYSLVRGDLFDQFHIDPSNGLISLAAELDREQSSSYSLAVRASDGGSPPTFSDVSVQVVVGDINDNAPRFARQNYTVVRREDTELNEKLLQLNVTDADTPMNGGPFIFRIVTGNERNAFMLTPEGAVHNLILFDRSQQEAYQLVIEVSDNGKPSLSTVTYVTVEVIEPSNPPVVASPLVINILSQEGHFPGGIIGWIHAEDHDPYDVLTYSLVNDLTHMFNVDPEDGKVLAQPDLDDGFYQLNISITDGQFTVYGEVEIDVGVITTDMLENSVSIRFDGLTPKKFVTYYLDTFKHTISNILRSPDSENVEIISIHAAEGAQDEAEVLFAVRKEPRRVRKDNRKRSGFIKARSLEQKVNESVSSLEERMHVKVLSVISDICSTDRCDKNHKCVTEIILDESSIATVYNTITSFVSPRHVRQTACLCKDRVESCDDPDVGTIGPIIPDACSSNPCPAYLDCVPNGVEFSCVCPENSIYCGDSSLRPLSFNGGSYVRYDTLELSTTSTQVEAAFHTQSSNGIIMHAEGSYDFSTLQIQDGLVYFHLECGSGEAHIRIAPNRVDDGQWHKIAVNRRGNSATITLDDQFSASGTAPGGNRELNLDTVMFGARGLSVGGSGQQRARRDAVEDGFVGCMGDLSYDGESLPRTGEGVSSTNTAECPAALLTACTSNPCYNGAVCVDYGYSFSCQCATGWTGSRCQHSTNPCLLQPCRNGGSCINIGTTDFECECPTGFWGHTCEVSSCQQSPCRHGGVCKEINLGFSCNCTATGHTGTYCEDVITECAQSPCKNGDRCYQLSDAYKCCSPKSKDPVCNEIAKDIYPNIHESSFRIGMLEIIIIIVVILLVLFCVMIFAVAMRRRRKRRSQNLRTDALAQTRYMDGYGTDSYKRDSKMSNLVEMPMTCQNTMHSPTPPPLPNRPTSYIPSNHNSLSHLDSDCGYDDPQPYHGQPISHQPSLAPVPSNSASDNDSIAKPAWEFDTPSAHESFVDGRESSKNMPLGVHPLQHSQPCILPPRHSPMPMGMGIPMDDPPAYRAPDIHSQADITSMSSLHTDNDEDALPGYHWDCTDWLPPQDLEHIPEVPQYTVPDSPTNISTNTGLNNEDYVTEDEYVGGEDTDYPTEDNDDDDDDQYAQAAIDFQQQLENYPPSPPPVPSDNGDFEGYGMQRYQQHPNQYLPQHRVSNSTIPPEYADEIAEDGLPYPQRSFTAPNRISPPHFAGDGSEYTADSDNGIPYMDNMSMSIYTSTNNSCSDVSGLGEPDSEIGLSEYDSGGGDDEDEDDEDDEPNELQAMLQSPNVHTDV